MRAVFVAFFASGFAFASWASRIPQVRDALGLDPGALGLVLLALAVGSVIALPVAGVVVTRLGAARTILAMSLAAGRRPRDRRDRPPTVCRPWSSGCSSSGSATAPGTSP